MNLPIAFIDFFDFFIFIISSDRIVSITNSSWDKRTFTHAGTNINVFIKLSFLIKLKKIDLQMLFLRKADNSDHPLIHLRITKPRR